jgi:hypothetical protein
MQTQKRCPGEPSALSGRNDERGMGIYSATKYHTV